MFKPVSSQVSFPNLEQEVLAFWKERDTFRKSVDRREGGPRFVFYEGPPTANGRPGIHHVLARVFKDVIPRYKTMKGYYTPRKGGWDTQGLPVELEIERELGISSKKEIEEFGIAAFNQRCRESVFRYLQDWEALTERIAFWIDMADAYVTYRNEYIESGWWIIRQLWDKGLVYQGYRVTPHCPRCGTSLSSHEVALGYQDNTDDPSVYVKFELEEAGPELTGGLPTYLLAWTTTPWTLPGNMALAVNPDAEYAVVETAGRDGQRERLILARELLGAAMKTEYQIVAELPGRDLVGRHYVPLYELLPVTGDAHRVVAGYFVSLEDGTGIVHIAPAFGEVDLELARAENLPILHTVDLRGLIIPAPVRFAEMFVKDADPVISDDLERRGLMYRRERILHTYPFCWRCDSPLLYYAKSSWYFRTTAVKEALLAANDRVNWYPEHIKQGRFGDWLENNVDWAFSRERYWGTPVPIWRCESCGHQECIGSIAELQARAPDKKIDTAFDLHRPYIDDVVWICPQCGGVMRRVPEVMDAWFDSGAMPVAQWHYPFENREIFEQNFPADFISEAIDQTRGWFYSLHAEAVMLFDQPCYRNVLCLGHILDGKGEKMSKTRGNVVDPWTVLNAQGADALRWYLFTASPPGNPRRFSAELVAEALRKFLLTLWNTYSFFVTYANIDGFVPQREPITAAEVASWDALDRWVLSELQTLIRSVDERMEQYDVTGAGRAMQTFVDDLSNWYVRRSRRRFWKSENDADKQAAYQTLYESLATLSKLMAPFVPFVSEEIYRNLVSTANPEAAESVHLADFPVADQALVDERLMAGTRLVMRIASLGRAARNKAALKVRQPLAEALVKLRTPDERAVLEPLVPQLLDELNVKKLAFIQDESKVADFVVKAKPQLLGPKYGREMPAITSALAKVDAREVARRVRAGETVEVAGHQLLPEELDVTVKDKPGCAVAVEGDYLVAVTTTVTPELAQEGMARELVHRIQTMRKNADFRIEERIVTYYQAGPAVAEVMRRFGSYVRQETLSVKLEPGAPPDGAYSETFALDGETVTLAVRREAK